MNRALSLILVMAAALVLGGCQTIGGWFSSDDTEPPAELVEFDSTATPEEVWSTRVGRGINRSAPRLRPFHHDGQVWVADYRGVVTSLDAQTGSRRTTIDTDLNLAAGPAVYDSMVLVGDFDGRLVALDPDSGQERWRARLSSEVLALPVLHDGVVIARSIDGRTYGFDAADGARLWVHDRSVPLLTLRGSGDPVARGGVVYLGHDDGVVSALRVESGSVIWEQQVSSGEGRTELERLADIDGSMYIVGTDLFAVTYHGRLVSMAIESGRTLWNRDIASHSGVVVERTRLAVTDSNDTVQVLDRRNGSTEWQNDRMARRQLTRPGFHGGYLVVGDKEGYLHWLDNDSGEFVARTRAGRDPFTGPPLVVGNLAYFHSTNGTVSAWRIRS